MISFVIISILIFTVAIMMTMVGKGGGNFYVVILAMANVPMHEAATTGQFILFSASLAAMIFFHKNKSVSWKLAFFIGALIAVAAFLGGFFSYLFAGYVLKIIFSVMLILAGLIMVMPMPKPTHNSAHSKFSIIQFRNDSDVYSINLMIALPVIILTGFFAGMVGVSGGSFLVPLMVLACNMPMHLAIGTASILISISSLMGFTGHAIQGDFNVSSALPLAVITIIGGILGGKFALKTKSIHLKKIFAYTNWLAALFMVINALHTKGLI